MRVLHITNSLKGGAGAAAYRIHESLLKVGVESSIVAQESNSNLEYLNLITLDGGLLRGTSRMERMKLLFKFPGYSIKRAFYSSIFRKVLPKINYDFVSMPYCNLQLAKIAEMNDYDIINLHWVTNIIDYPFFFKQCKKPIVWTLHDINPIAGLYHYPNDEQNNIERSGSLSKAISELKIKAINQHESKKIFIGPSKWITDVAKRSLSNYNHAQAVEIPNPINLDIFNVTFKADARRKLGLPVDKKIILFTANDINNYRKGFDQLLDVLQMMDDNEIMPVALGIYPEKLVESDILFTGMINNDEILANYYSAADVVVIPSREDNLPNVMLEAFACGCPVIAFPIGGLQQHVIDNYTGVLAKSLDVMDLKKAINYFFKNLESFDHEKIRQYSIQQFAPNLIAGKYKEIYQSITQ